MTRDKIKINKEKKTNQTDNKEIEEFHLRIQ